MRKSLTDVLCTQCGMCCDGSLFADVELSGPAEATRLEIMGLDVDEDEADAGLLSQPCAALRSKRCSIYAHRPKCCRVFECRLLQDAQNGAVSVERARELIAATQQQIRRVRVLLDRLGKHDRRLPLKERCAEALAREDNAAPGAARARADLKAAMSTVQRMIWNTFLGTGRRGK